MTLPLSKSLTELPEYGQVLANLIARDLKVKYQSKALGFIWSLLHPAIMIGIWYVVFTMRVINQNIHHYWAFLLPGILVYQFIQSSIIEAAYSIRKNGGIIRKVYVPMEILVIAAVTVKMVEFLLQMLVTIALLACLHRGDQFAESFSTFKTLVMLPGGLALLYLFVLGVSMPLAAWTVIYRDLDHMIGLALTALFYITPVFWMLWLDPAKPHRWGWVFALNPAMALIELFRGPMYWGNWPTNPAIVGSSAVTAWLVASLFAFGSFVVGYALLNRTKHILAEVV
jgi:ABC-type polysaccharide/polyol phosphate export permease